LYQSLVLLPAWPSAVWRLPSAAACCLLPAACRLPPAACRLPPAACRLLAASLPPIRLPPVCLRPPLPSPSALPGRPFPRCPALARWKPPGDELHREIPCRACGVERGHGTMPGAPMAGSITGLYY